MTLEEHAHQLGKMLANYQSLEFLLRVYLHSLPGAVPHGIPYGTDLYSLPVGSQLPENEFTNYKTLGMLIKQYNEKMSERGNETIDEGLVTVRDALAHGRVSAEAPSDTFRLLKFSKPAMGKVRVTFNETMNADWFMEHGNRLSIAISAVHRNILILNEIPNSGTSGS